MGLTIYVWSSSPQIKAVDAMKLQSYNLVRDILTRKTLKIESELSFCKPLPLKNIENKGIVLFC